MLDHLRGRVSDRKLRLFAVACCRRVPHLLTGRRHQAAVDVAERFAEGMATGEDFEAAGNRMRVRDISGPLRFGSSMGRFSVRRYCGAKRRLECLL